MAQDYRMQLKAGEAPPQFRSRHGYSNDEVISILPLGGAYPLPETFLELMSPMYSGYKLMKQNKDKENLTELEAKQIEDNFLIQEFFFSLFVSLLAGATAFSCSYTDDAWFSGTMAVRWVNTIFAFMLGSLYLVYYVWTHLIGDSILTEAGLVSTCLPQMKSQLPSAPPLYGT